MKEIAYIITILLIPSFLSGQGLINNAAYIQTVNKGTIKISGGGILSQGNSTISNSGKIFLDKDWIQTGISASYTGSGWLIFENGISQKLYSDNPLSISKLRTVNSDKLQINNELTITDSLDLTNNGSLQLGIYNLILSPAAVLINYDKNNYIITNSSGYLQAETGSSPLVFPIGNSSYNPLTLINNGTTDNFRVNVEDRVWTGGTGGTIITTDIVNRTWHISEEITGGSVADLTVQWDSNEETAGFDRNNSAISHHDSTDWEHSMIYTNALNIGINTWTQSRLAQSSFSPFAVEDVSFTAVENLSGMPQTEMHLMPNPTNDVILLRFENCKQTSVMIFVFDMNGQLIFQTETDISSGSAVELPESRKLIAGTYLVKAVFSDNMMNSFFVKKT